MFDNIDGQSLDKNKMGGDEIEGNDLYARLARPFGETFWDNRGGVDLEYVRRITRR